MSHSLSRRWALSLLCMPCLLFAARAANATTCESLTNLALPNTIITLAQVYAAGETVSGSNR